MGFELIKISQLLAEKKIKTISPSLKLQTDDINEIGKTAVVSQDQDFIVGYTDLVDEKLTNVPYIIFGDHTEIFKYIDFPFAQGADGIKIIKADDKYIDSKFLYYAMKSCYYPTGFYQRHFKLLRKTFIPNLKINHQKKISSVLNNYDQLIINNNKRMALLEKMAESLYKEWFIRFRFPGHENTKFINGIPEKWNYEKFSDVCPFIRGISYSSEQIENQDAPNLLINLKNLRDYGGFRKENYKKYDGDYKPNQVLKKFDLIMAITEMVQERRIIGYVGLVPSYEDNCVMSSDLVKITSRINNLFLYSMFTYGGVSLCFSQYGNGTNVIHLKPQSLRNIKLLIPEKSLIERFVNIVGNYFEMIDKLQLENENLSKQRDSLLPRLISGKLSIDEKEIA